MRLGADADQLERTAATCADAAVRLRAGCSSLAAEAHSVRWVGPDRDQAMVLLDRQLIPIAAATAQRLDGAAQALRSHAAAQRRVSAASGVRAWSMLLLDPFGPGTAAMSIGDITTATHVAILVPGMGSSLGNFDAQVDHAVRLQSAAAELVAPTEGVAVVAWLGYDAPGPLREPTSAIEVLSSHDAEVGAARLRTFIDDLRLRDDVTLTLIGHSYGSLVVADAARRNPLVDRVLVLGSPGLGVDDARALGLDDGAELFAGAARSDLVARSEWFGRDPTDPKFGATVIDASIGDGGPEPGFPRSHSSYFDERSHAAANIASIIADRRPTPARRR